MSELLVGTRKGLFILEGEPGAPFGVAVRAFPGETVEYALRDPRTNRLFASVTSPFYGPKIWFTDDPGGEWSQAEGVALPEGGEQALERIWTIASGRITRRTTTVRPMIDHAQGSPVMRWMPSSSERRTSSSGCRMLSSTRFIAASPGRSGHGARRGGSG